ncbi:amidohydrolase family-domain-containing protein [Epithele typhae]|uniref:amidohydrolase family-domain-containing protein n=1 Tax=Epithele typhae TaxID=378194 RepID=UPI0020077C62|nr:amidohydrolase family-domain-containing protein [Epithele typhae]KAH9922335.1 amidohydrolase family-domain-containing protein [Epithele typhae]
MAPKHNSRDVAQQAASNGSARQQVVWALFATATAGLSSYYYSLTQATSLRTSLPASYALCAHETGKVHTVDSAAPAVDCVVVDKARVTATGSLADVQTWWDDYQNELIFKFYGNEPKAKKPLPVFTAPPNAIIVPGLTDAHAHLIEYGFKVQLRLDQVRSISALLDVLEAYADLGSRPALAGLPIALHRVDVHALWLSPRALALTRTHLGGSFPASVPGGQIVRGDDGEPTGVFLDAAQELVPVPKWSAQKKAEYAARVVRDAVAVGLTSVHDASMEMETLELFKSMNAEGKLPIRVYAMADTDRMSPDEAEHLEIYDPDPAARVRMRSVKLFTDGALGSWGAALLTPYSDKPGETGIMRFPEAEYAKMVRTWWERGWGINTHAIGDRANKAVLDTFEELLKTSDDKEAVARRRPRIEHAQIMRVEDLHRAGELGVLTSVQPTHATSDMWYAEKRLVCTSFSWDVTWPERILLLKASPNGILPLGSDFPVEDINPLLGFYAAVSRLDVEGKSPHGEDGWYSSERLTRSQALKGMTLDAAYAAFAEDTLGSLSAGKRADYVVLDRNIMDEEGAFSEILETKVLATVVDGQIVYGGI